MQLKHSLYEDFLTHGVWRGLLPTRQGGIRAFQLYLTRHLFLTRHLIFQQTCRHHSAICFNTLCSTPPFSSQSIFRHTSHSACYNEHQHFHLSGTTTTTNVINLTFKLAAMNLFDIVTTFPPSAVRVGHRTRRQ